MQWAARLAAETDATITAVTVWNYPPALMMPVVGAPVVPADFVADRSREVLAQIVDAADTGDVAIEQSVVMGAARAVLVEHSSEHDLLVLGRTGDGRLKQAILGSTVSHCVRHAECPVAIVGESDVPEAAITVAVDGSATSIEALVWAIGLGDDREVLAVFSHDEWELDDLPLDDKVRRELDGAADATLTAAVHAATGMAGVDATRVLQQVRQGDPRTTIVDQADPARILVLGAQGHTGIARWALGSLADYAVQRAPGTVVIWR